MNIYFNKTRRRDEMENFFRAVQDCKVNEIKKIISELGNDLLKIRENGRTPLDIAIHRRSLEVAEILIQYGANIDADTKNLVNPFLLEAVYQDNIPMVNLLIEYGKHLPSISYTIMTKSIFKAKSIQMANFLLQNGADINAIRDDEESTIAHTFWSSQVSLEFCEFLLSFNNGINLSIQNKNGLNAIQYCKSLLIEDVKPKLMQKYDKIRNDKIMLLMLAYSFDEESLIYEDYLSKDMFLLITKDI